LAVSLVGYGSHMKTPFKFILAVVALGVVGAGLWYVRADQAATAPAAVAPAAPAYVPPVWLPRVVRFLGLTGDQRAKLATLRHNFRTSVAATRKDASLTPVQKRDKIREATKAALVEAGKVLTPAQRAKLQKIQRLVTRAGLRALEVRQELRHERQFWSHHRFNSPRPPIPGGMQRPMGMMGPGPAQHPGMQPATPGKHLNAEQRAKLAALTKTYREQVQAIMNAP